MANNLIVVSSSGLSTSMWASAPPSELVAPRPLPSLPFVATSPPTATTPTSPTVSHTVAAAEGAAPPADNTACVSTPDAATPTHSTTAQHPPTFALRLRSACRMDKATRIAVLTVAAPHATDIAAAANSAAEQPVFLALEYAERSAVAKCEPDDTAPARRRYPSQPLASLLAR
ncbi:hypothetical protein HYPSUDRAFT_209264 [Hypholoma sublateritium FD-334 SS-4]|uniref:Uncharacterized protein n=1 Tax=Hypholoma sublateritium (strain FD-334 SS-4) TaxID=945553 RepID=A0A0D2N3F2_HYPSF|nr:hypothetical protein HYPSUDRAFT_209264 [Hypholoma sublateritium FD-334 SS-4]